MHWIVANRKKERAVSVSVADKTCCPMAATIERVNREYMVAAFGWTFPALTVCAQ
jgi:hypothetical protein